MNNRSLFFLKSQQKKLTLLTADFGVFVVYSSPLRQKKLHFKTQLLSHSGASPLHVTHNSNSLWSLAVPHLPQWAPQGLWTTACSLTKGTEEKAAVQEVVYSVVGIWGESRFAGFGSQLGAVSHRATCQKWTCTQRLSKSGHIIPFFGY